MQYTIPLYSERLKASKGQLSSRAYGRAKWTGVDRPTICGLLFSFFERLFYFFSIFIVLAYDMNSLFVT